MKNFIDKKVLITTQNWFVAPDGIEYRAAWGTLRAIHEAGKTLGFIPNRSHANWFIEIGNMVIMGCQVMYVVQCDEKPNTGKVDSWTFKEGLGVSEFQRPSHIYITE
jgi:hypothetical protein